MKITGITTSNMPSEKTLYFVQKLMDVIPNSIFFKRKKLRLKQVLRFFKKKNIEIFLIFVEKKKNLSQMWQINIKQKVVIKFKIKSFVIKKNSKIKISAANRRFELMFCNFKNKIGNFLVFFVFKLFQNVPGFANRQILFFYLTKNLIFIRVYRYVFSFSGKDIKLQELGPRITLKFSNAHSGYF